MSKIKMRCITCGKWFQSANAKEVTCPDCMQKARREKMAARTAPPKTGGQAAQGVNTPAQPTVPPPPKPKAASSGTSHWLDTLSDVKVGEPDQQPRPKIPSSPAPREPRGGADRPDNRGSGGYKDKEGGYHSPAAYRVGDITGTIGQRPRQTIEPDSPRGPRIVSPGEVRPEKRGPGDKQGGSKTGKPKAARPAAPPRPKREKTPPPPPFKPTPEQIEQVEARYKELAVPVEFDGIRTQIAKEMGIPKKAVKQIIKDLREREDIPSWWDAQTYQGDSEELAKIKAAYEVHLPLPPVGVHKQIAEALSLKPGTVYQAIKLIREEMNLPQYNDPALHGLELAPRKRKKAEAQPEAEPAPAISDTTPGGEEGAANAVMAEAATAASDSQVPKSSEGDGLAPA